MKKYLPPFKKARLALIPTTVLLLLCLLAVLIFEVMFQDKFYPGIYLGDTNLAYLTRAQAYSVLSAKFESRKDQPLEFNLNGQRYQVDLSNTPTTVDFQNSLDQAFNLGRSGPLVNRASDQLMTLLFKRTFLPTVDLSSDEQIQAIDKQIYQPPKEGRLEVSEDQVKIIQSENGFGLDKPALKNALSHYLTFGEISKELPTRSVEPKVTTAKLQIAKNFLDSTKNQPIKLTYQTDSWEIDNKTLITLIDLNQDGENLISQEKLMDYLKTVAEAINQPVKEGQFQFDPNTKRVSVFTPSQNGQELDIDSTRSQIILALENQGPRTISLPVKVVQPKVNLADVNNMGINQLLGRGISHFAGSIDNRIYNIGLAASRINGALIAPGETFSFNNTVGDISGASGYKPAYVINNGRTVLDDGGGVCQVSTTIFRAVLNAGLPVLARTAHAYRVGYYEQGFPPGLDATVFAPSVDFIFKNDTPNHILIQAYRDGLTLYVDLYGTSDGRVATLSKPVVTNQTPPPPDLHQDDPTLPKGTVKQVDFSAWGANVSFTRVVKRGSETLISETFRSNFKPWQAIYLVGTK